MKASLIWYDLKAKFCYILVHPAPGPNICPWAPHIRHLILVIGTRPPPSDFYMQLF